jgi:hypothetical protein
MKCLYKYLDVAKIIWYHQEHTYEDGTLAHGALDRDFQPHKSQYASCISPKLKAWIQDWLDNGLTTRQIYEEHKKMWYNAWLLGRETCVDDFLIQKTIQYYKNKMKSKKLETSS